MDVRAYLERICFTGKPEPNLDTLIQLQRQHLLTISYENLDVHLGRRLDLDLVRSYTKIVNQRRGGWCYEMNGLLEWALREIGFDVMRMSAGVSRSLKGDVVLGNHLVLCVHLDQPWIADVGFGDGAFDPIPMTPQRMTQRGFEYGLKKVGDYWRFINHSGGAADSFDFLYAPADETLLAEQCHWLSTADDSPFMSAVVCQRFVPQGYEIQQGLVARQVTTDGEKKWTIQSADELVETLHTRFALDVPEIATIWDQIAASHEKYLASLPGS